MRPALAAVVLAAACSTPTVAVEPVATVDHPAVTLYADDPSTTSARWRDGCDLQAMAGSPTVWLLRTGPDGTELYLPSPDGGPRTRLPGPVSCRWNHTDADRRALADELASVPASERWKWGDDHRS